MYTIRDFQKGEIIFKEHSIGLTAFVIKSGTVEISRQFGLKRVVLALLKANNIFGEMALLSDGKRNAQALALESCELIEFDRENLKSLLHQTPQIVHVLCLNLLQRLKSTSDRIRPAPADDPFYSICSLLDLMAHDRQSGRYLHVPHQQFLRRIKDVLNLPEVEIKRLVQQMQALNLIEIQSRAGDNGEIQIVNAKTYMTRARSVADEIAKNLGSNNSQHTEFVDLKCFAELIAVQPERLYARMAEGQVPEDLFLFHRDEALRWATHMGKKFFKEPTLQHQHEGAEKHEMMSQVGAKKTRLRFWKNKV